MTSTEQLMLAHAKGYRVTKDGRAISPKGRVLALNYNRWGYQINSFRGPGRKTCHFASHRLQAYQKFGSQMFDAGIQVRHLNNNSRDNSYNNIAIGTSSQNYYDSDPELRRAVLAKATMAATRFDHDSVMAFHQESGSYRRTMERFGISSKGTLHNIIQRKSPALARRLIELHGNERAEIRQEEMAL